MSRAAGGRIAQVAVSLVVMGLLLRQTDRDLLGLVLSQARIGPLLLALVTKALSLLLHELRLWVALPAPRPPVGRVVAVGFGAGVLNLVLPGRAGDVAAVVYLRQHCGVPVATATAAVGVVGFLEAAPFGAALLGLLLIEAERWRLLLGEEGHQHAVQWLGLGTGGALLVAVAAVLLGKRLAAQPVDDRGPGLLTLLRDTLLRATEGLTAAADVALNVGLGVVQVALMVGAFTLGLSAAGLDLPSPALAAAGVLALSSLASVALPPTFGAGPAAASVAVLGLFGVGPEGAIAYAGAWWLISQGPALVLGLPALASLGARPGDRQFTT